MPELPEVEVTRRGLAPSLEGQCIARVRCTKPSYFFLSSPKQLAAKLTGRTVTRLGRQGKYLVAQLDDESRLLLHLGMTGQLFFAGSSSPRLLSQPGHPTHPTLPKAFQPDQHTHLWLQFQSGCSDLYFRDVRKFGKVRWLAPGQSDARLDKLGPDALSASGEHLYARSRGRAAPAKTFLLDQGVLAGVGNIYADEALFRSRIRPTRKSSRLTRAACELLACNVRRVLQRSIDTGGSSISDFISADGSDGKYQNERRVYARTNEPCWDCGTPIRRIVVGQRGTHFCGKCQPR